MMVYLHLNAPGAVSRDMVLSYYLFLLPQPATLCGVIIQWYAMQCNELQWTQSCGAHVIAPTCSSLSAATAPTSRVLRVIPAVADVYSRRYAQGGDAVQRQSNAQLQTGAHPLQLRRGARASAQVMRLLA